ncbi:hypothetical protein POSPLADRAFT_1045457 [Postia placenta MAD-698-R-SB12]|uniref:Integrase catalytic domain-containing protein n=1 Tax=Postia placenta MAD-698-R-SB12 TaxID=670580 RepID=A0A1X6N7C8_9APHY|nr:hypothetical protein POSPLADRAFT_1045457 [Postia placenta MAD-698-R-SB12]OSX64400.1 hypothetical protein POSPLADRAFT_1045457 [Postia placenta MAD-698-R-SB12]
MAKSEKRSIEREVIDEKMGREGRRRVSGAKLHRPENILPGHRGRLGRGNEQDCLLKMVAIPLRADVGALDMTSRSCSLRSAPPDCPVVERLLRQYHKRNICSRVTLSNIFRDKHGILISPTNIDRHRKKLNLRGSKVTTRSLSDVQKRQLVLDQMVKDPTRRQGPQIIKEGILFDTGLNLTRDYITSEMHIHDPEGFALRRPTARKVHREALVALGPHHEWSGDGHDKLSAIGFPIWGVRDKWSGKWLGLWVVLNNRRKDTIAFLYLRLIRELSGMPIQMTTDCGSKTTSLHGFANALRELVQWLWPMLIQCELDMLKECLNSHIVRCDLKKKLPSGTSLDIAYDLFACYGGDQCLQPVDCTVVDALMKDLGGEDLIWFCISVIDLLHPIGKLDLTLFAGADKLIEFIKSSTLKHEKEASTHRLNQGTQEMQGPSQKASFQTTAGINARINTLRLQAKSETMTVDITLYAYPPVTGAAAKKVQVPSLRRQFKASDIANNVLDEVVLRIVCRDPVDVWIFSTLLS